MLKDPERVKGQIITCGRFQGEAVLHSPAQGAEPEVQVEEPGVLGAVLVGEARVPQAEAPPHVLDDAGGPVEEGVGGVLELQDGAFQDQVHRVLTPEGLRGESGLLHANIKAQIKGRRLHRDQRRTTTLRSKDDEGALVRPRRTGKPVACCCDL